MMAKDSEVTASMTGNPGADEEDDYMNISVTDLEPPKFETSMQRRARQKREAELRSRPKSKAELKAEEAAAREAALGTSIDSSNKGFQMMQKLGFKGGALGKPGGAAEAHARTEPIALTIKEGKGGIGLDSEKKRKFREQVEGEAKRVKAEEGEYRERMMREREMKRLEGQIIGAMSVAEKLDEEEEGGGAAEATQGDNETESDLNAAKRPRLKSKPLSKVNVLWRASVRHRVEKERDRRMRYDLYQSLSRQPTYDDADEEKEDRQALGKEVEEIEEDDPELEEFLALEPEVRLDKLVTYLKATFHYCFWCKHRYSDAAMEGCPGVTEEDHD